MPWPRNTVRDEQFIFLMFDPSDVNAHMRDPASVRQVSPDSAQLEAIVGGLTPGEPHTIAVHKSGDLSRGPAAVGGVFQGDVAVQAGGRKAGELCTASADDKGVLRCKGPADLLKVWEIIGAPRLPPKLRKTVRRTWG